MLLPEVGPAKDAVINSDAFRRRQRELVESLRKNSFVSSLADADIRADTSQPNLPRLTLIFSLWLSTKLRRAEAQ